VSVLAQAKPAKLAPKCVQVGVAHGEGVGISIYRSQELGYDFDPEMVAMTLGLVGDDA